MIWEVKPFGSSAAEQLKRYSESTGYELGAGKVIKPVKGIEIYGNLKMDIYFTEPGTINYALSLKNKRISVDKARDYVNETYAANNPTASEWFMKGIVTGGAVFGGTLLKGLKVAGKILVPVKG
ncbi:hypothetical protein [Paenibacillus ihumii]|uniref:hypothetical protein n=1 Tax=Paenibacillus ihumii TaxID=687436 RepID=UPI0006D847B5|nr:hypothetical protein [Paenibacillus ihumii]